MLTWSTYAGLRQAIACAIDRERIIRDIGRGYATVTDGMSDQPARHGRFLRHHAGVLGYAAAMLALLLMAALSAADEPVIQDNSLLTEEAYNQERGVVQHINFFQRDRTTGDWIYTFTQEWPAPAQKHQLSYTVPLPQGHRGDIALNYRYQLLGNSEAKLAATPRLSLILPTGNSRRGEGNGAVGYNAAMAVSYAPVEQWNVHFDAGATVTPHSKGTKHSFDAANNIVWQPAKRWNAMLEGV